MDAVKIARLLWISRTAWLRRQGASVILEPLDDWPEHYLESFAGVSEDFVRPDQGHLDERERLA